MEMAEGIGVFRPVVEGAVVNIWVKIIVDRAG